jgi:hypothetical protein
MEAVKLLITLFSIFEFKNIWSFTTGSIIMISWAAFFSENDSKRGKKHFMRQHSNCPEWPRNNVLVQNANCGWTVIGKNGTQDRG